VLTPFVEAYRVVADVLARQPIGEPWSEKDCVQQSLAYGRQAYLQRRISSEASIGKLLFSNGYRLMENLELIDGNDDSVAERRLEMAQTFRALQRRLERVRAAALP
jgi:glycerol-3-phosphate O-acyltransferase